MVNCATYLQLCIDNSEIDVNVQENYLKTEKGKKDGINIYISDIMSTKKTGLTQT